MSPPILNGYERRSGSTRDRRPLAHRRTPSRDCWIRESVPTSSHCGHDYIKAGQTSPSDEFRGLLDFDVSTIPGSANVTSAAAHLYQEGTQTVGVGATDYALFAASKKFDWAASWNSSGAMGTWNGGTPSGTAYGTRDLAGAGTGYRAFGGNLSQLVQGWVNGTIPRRGLVLKQHNGPVNAVLFFVSSIGPASKRPYLNVNYTVPNSAPTTPQVTVSPCVAPCSQSPLVLKSWEPTLSASATDSDDTVLTISFQIRDATTQVLVAGDAAEGSSAGSPTYWVVPAGSLSDEPNRLYDFRVGAADGQYTTWSTWRRFQIDPETEDVPEPVMTEYGVDEATLEDIKDYGDVAGISESQAIAMYSWQEQFNSAVDTIAAAHPTTFAYSEMNPNDQLGALIEFVGPVPQDAVDLVADLPVDVTLTDDAEYSDATIQEMIDSAHTSIVAQAGAGAEAGVYFDNALGKLVASVYSPATSTSKDSYVAGVHAEVAVDIPEIVIPDVDVYIVTESFNTANTSLKAGGGLNDTGAGSPCTAGFAVQSVTAPGRRGMMTADHCGNQMTFYSAPDFDDGVDGPYGPRQVEFAESGDFLSRRYGDAQFHQVSQPRRFPIGNRFFKSPSKTRRAKAVLSAGSGDIACLYGRITKGIQEPENSRPGKRTCGKIIGTHYTFNQTYPAEATYSDTAFLGGAVSVRGDSGGPMFRGHGALGLLSGRSSIPSGLPGYRSPITVFTKMINISSRMGLYVKLAN